jgi:phospho-N-acetylmuramoyl-pentapeptide-transferase
MGDTGSLALGTLLAALAIDAHVLLFLPLLGIVFVVEALSVIAQVVSFKLTGKRIFKMSPLHHHFELSGWSEKKVTAVFSAVSVLASAAFCVIVYLSNLRIPPH